MVFSEAAAPSWKRLCYCAAGRNSSTGLQVDQSCFLFQMERTENRNRCGEAEESESGNRARTTMLSQQKRRNGGIWAGLLPLLLLLLLQHHLLTFADLPQSSSPFLSARALQQREGFTSAEAEAPNRSCSVQSETCLCPRN